MGKLKEIEYDEKTKKTSLHRDFYYEREEKYHHAHAEHYIPYLVLDSTHK